MRETLLRFISVLRATGLSISVAESIDAMNAVTWAGLERIRLREALAAALVKDEAQRPAFDTIFSDFFRAGAAPQHGIRRRSGGDRGLRGLGPGEPSHGRNEPPSAKEEEQESLDLDWRAVDTDRNAHARFSTGHYGTRWDFEGQSERAVPDGAQLNKGEEARSQGWELAQTYAAERELEGKPFADYSGADYTRARQILGHLIRRLRVRIGRRLRFNKRGRVDLRRSLRAAIQYGGAPLDLRFRARRPRHAELLMLADVSGSMRYSAALGLELIGGSVDLFRRVRSFVYIDRLAEAGFESGHLTMTPALDLYARSDFGRVLQELWARRDDLLNSATLLVILGDARNNRRPARADRLREIVHVARAVIWLIPEEPARWNTGDSAIGIYAREVNWLVKTHNLRELEASLGRLPLAGSRRAFPRVRRADVPS